MQPKKSAAPPTPPRLRPFTVESWDDTDGREEVGTVLLYDGADAYHVEHALAAVGLYCPRGADTLDWGYSYGQPFAVIRDASGRTLARLEAK